MNNIIINPHNKTKLFFVILFFYFFLYNYKRLLKKKKIGIISVRNEVNIGNNLVKYSISQKLKELGFIPYIIGTLRKSCNIAFLNESTNLIIIKNNFSEIKYNDYDILMVNSDQTWNKYDNNFYDYGFLKFAENWTIPRFAYGASYGDKWVLNKEDELIAKNLLKQFIGISVRERSAIEILQKKLNVNSIHVLDPTLLLNKKDYLKLIKNYKSNISINENYIFSYIISPTEIELKIVKEIALRLNYNVHFILLEKNPSIQNFIYLISNCKAVITNSYHGTIFSIIFNKPFIVLGDPKAKRFESLGEIFDIKSRFINDYKIPDLSLLKIPLKKNKILLNALKKNSLIFLKKIYNY